jgi:Transposase DDE domain group 1
MQEARDLFR